MDSSLKNGFFPEPSVCIRSQTYMSWSKKKEAVVYKFLWSYIVRQDIYTGEKALYKNFFQNGWLASSFSVRDLSKYIDGTPNNYARMNKYTKSLAEQGFIKTFKVDLSNGRNSNIYVFGRHDFHDNERLFLWEHFRPIAEEEEKARKSKRMAEIEASAIDFNALPDPKNWLL
jgi:hypothetical protein